MFIKAMQQLWDIGTIDNSGRADLELRRTYHLITKGQAPLTEAEVIKLGQMSEPQLRLLLRWLSHRLSLAESTRSRGPGRNGIASYRTKRAKQLDRSKGVNKWDY